MGVWEGQLFIFQTVVSLVADVSGSSKSCFVCERRCLWNLCRERFKMEQNQLEELALWQRQ